DDIVDGSVSVTCDRGSDLLTPVGTTVVTCVSEDSLGNRASETFTITVSYTPPPVAPTPGDPQPRAGEPEAGTSVAGEPDSESPAADTPATDNPVTNGPGA